MARYASRPRRTARFHGALVYAFVCAIGACLIAAVASLLRGGKYQHIEATTPAATPATTPTVAEAPVRG